MDKSRNLKILTIPFAVFVIIIAISKLSGNTFFEQNIAGILNGISIVLIALTYFVFKKSKLILNAVLAIIAVALLINIYYFIVFSINNDNTKYYAMLSIIPFSGYLIYYYNEVFD